MVWVVPPSSELHSVADVVEGRQGRHVLGLRLVRRRHARPSGRRIRGEAGRPQAHPHSLQHRGVRRHSRRPCADGLVHLGRGARPDPGRHTPRARGDHRGAAAGGAERADLQGAGLRSRRQHLVRAGGAEGNAEGDRGAAQQGNRPHHGLARNQEARHAGRLRSQGADAGATRRFLQIGDRALDADRAGAQSRSSRGLWQFRSSNGANVRLAADIGGTFTDIAVFDDKTGRLTFGKALSTPDRLVDGISSGVEKAGSDYGSANLFLHGSTVAINTMLERTGAKTALVTTEGFRDVYEIGRINRPDAYNLYFQKHKPLIERALCFEVKERVRADGEVLIAARRGGAARAERQAGRARHRSRRHHVHQLLRQRRARGAGQGAAEQAPSRHVRLGLARAVAGVSRVRARARPSPPTPISGRRCASTSARSTSTSARPASTARS